MRTVGVDTWQDKIGTKIASGRLFRCGLTARGEFRTLQERPREYRTLGCHPYSVESNFLLCLRRPRRGMAGGFYLAGGCMLPGGGFDVYLRSGARQTSRHTAQHHWRSRASLRCFGTFSPTKQDSPAGTRLRCLALARRHLLPRAAYAANFAGSARHLPSPVVPESTMRIDAR